MTRRPASAGIDGILLIDKEAAWTSHDVVAKSRGITRQRRTGHTGTLDPAATGLLVLALGRATRLVEYMSGHDKEYEGEIALGTTTDTDDADGTPIETFQVPEFGDGELRALEQRFSGELHQIPPAYSAVKVDGKRAYAVARKGGSLELAARAVVVHELDLERRAADRIAIRVACGPGTYVRSLARDIGGALGCGGHLACLRRTRCGPFDVDEAVAIGELEQIAAAGQLSRVLRSADEGVMELDALIVANERGSFLANGRAVAIRTEPWHTAERARIYRIDGRFVGIGRVDDGGLIHSTKVFEASATTG